MPFDANLRRDLIEAGEAYRQAHGRLRAAWIDLCERVDAVDPEGVQARLATLVQAEVDPHHTIILEVERRTFNRTAGANRRRNEYRKRKRQASDFEHGTASPQVTREALRATPEAFRGDSMESSEAFAVGRAAGLIGENQASRAQYKSAMDQAAWNKGYAKGQREAREDAGAGPGAAPMSTEARRAAAIERNTADIGAAMFGRKPGERT